MIKKRPRVKVQGIKNLRRSAKENPQPEKRHYCNTCGKKRNESKMHIIGPAPYGKNLWRCNSHLTVYKKP